MSASGAHRPPEFKHAADTEWQTGRFGNVTKFQRNALAGRQRNGFAVRGAIRDYQGLTL